MVFTSSSLLLVLVAAGCTTETSAGVSGEPCSCENFEMDCTARGKVFLLAHEICNDSWKINLHNNNLDQFPDGLSDFTFVRVSKNKLSRLPNPHQLKTTIENLKLDDNKISDSTDELRNFSSLQFLDLSRNRLTNLDFLPQPCSLRSLSLDNNAVLNLEGPLQNCSQLLNLSMRFNNITSLPPRIFSQMRSLDTLHLENNAIASVSDKAFEGLIALRILILSSNEITSLSSQSFLGMQRLEVLHLAHNRLMWLPNRMFTAASKLEHLNIARNELVVLPTDFLWGLRYVRSVSLWNNDLTEMPVLRECCEELQQIDFSHNHISSPSERAVNSALRCRTTLDLSKNPIRPESMRWAVDNRNFTTFVNPDVCNCGGFRNRLGVVDFCLDVHCQGWYKSLNWTGVVRARTSSIV